MAKARTFVAEHLSSPSPWRSLRACHASESNLLRPSGGHGEMPALRATAGSISLQLPGPAGTPRARSPTRRVRSSMFTARSPPLGCPLAPRATEDGASRRSGAAQRDGAAPAADGLRKRARAAASFGAWILRSPSLGAPRAHWPRRVRPGLAAARWGRRASEREADDLVGSALSSASRSSTPRRATARRRRGSATRSRDAGRGPRGAVLVTKVLRRRASRTGRRRSSWRGAAGARGVGWTRSTSSSCTPATTPPSRGDLVEACARDEARAPWGTRARRWRGGCLPGDRRRRVLGELPDRAALDAAVGGRRPGAGVLGKRALATAPWAARPVAFDRGSLGPPAAMAWPPGTRRAIERFSCATQWARRASRRRSPARALAHLEASCARPRARPCRLPRG